MMRTSPQLLRINRNFAVCFAFSALLSAVATQLLSGHDSHVNTTVTIIIGYVVYFAIFSVLFYRDNRTRYRQMGPDLIKREIVKMVSSFGVGEVVYLGIRWPTLYYFLETGVEPFVASLVSEVIATACYMVAVTVFLRRTGTF